MNTFLRLALIVFFAGAAVMVFELVGARIMAPYLGASTYVWTSVIGVILGSLSFGYWYGGRLADRTATFSVLSRTFLFVALSMGVTVWIHTHVLEFIALHIQHLALGSFVSALVLFAPASIFLGMVTPLAVRLSLEDIEHAGRTVGNLYAISTMGSIVGTFAAGFFLIPFFGSLSIMTSLVVLIWILSIASFLNTNSHFSRPLAFMHIVVVIVMVSFLFPRPSHGFVAYKESMYGSMYITEQTYNSIPSRILWIDRNMHSAMALDNSTQQVFPYSLYYNLADVIHPNIKNTLMIGGGAYSFPKYFLETHATATIDVVEIDPALTSIAREHFNLKDSPRMNIVHQDARIFLNHATKTYDVVYGDAFLSHLGPPPQLVTIEALEHIHRVLADDGVFVVNLVGAIEGDDGRFLRAFYWTNRALFDQVYVFMTSAPDPSITQNFVILAMKGDDTSFRESDKFFVQNMLSTEWNGEIAQDVPILSDDYVPVDYYMSGMLGRKYLEGVE